MNRYTPHIIVLPEDRANEKIANGFSNHLKVKADAMKVERPAGGWKKVLAKFSETLVPEMQKFSNCSIVLLIDFDRDEERLNYVKRQIPADLSDRVFVIGVFSEPEHLKRESQKNFESIGEALAKDCFGNKSEMWGHDLLKHNKNEIDRMIVSVKHSCLTCNNS